MTGALSRQPRHRSWSSIVRSSLPKILAILLVACMPAWSLLAQEDGDLADEFGDAAAPVVEPDAGAVPPAADPAADAVDAVGEADQTAPDNLLAWTFQALGLTYTVIFFALSITLLTLIVMNLLSAAGQHLSARPGGRCRTTIGGG